MPTTRASSKICKNAKAPFRVRRIRYAVGEAKTAIRNAAQTLLNIQTAALQHNSSPCGYSLAEPINGFYIKRIVTRPLLRLTLSRQPTTFSLGVRARKAASHAPRNNIDGERIMTRTANLLDSALQIGTTAEHNSKSVCEHSQDSTSPDDGDAISGASAAEI